MKRFLICLLFWVMLSACASTQPSPTSLPLPTAEILAVPLEIAPTASQPQQFEGEATDTASAQTPERDLYKINATLSYRTHRLGVEQEIIYTNRSIRELSWIYLIIEAAQEARVFDLDLLTIQQGDIHSQAELAGVELGLHGLMRVPLQSPLAPGETLTLHMAYNLNLPDTGGVFGYTPRQVNLSNWFPYVAPTDEFGSWFISPPAAAGEHLVYESVDFEVVLQLNDPALIVAGPAPAQIMETGFRYELEGARTFSLSISPDFEVLEQIANGIPVRAYVFPEHRSAGQAALTASSQALEIYADLFGPYPYNSLAVVEIDYEDGLESDGLFFLGQPFFENYDGTKQNYLTALSVHEVAHNWWFGLVGNDQARQPFLDEALSTYSEYLFYERAHPELVDWWWQFRINRFAPTGRVDSSIYEHTDFSSYVQAVYFRGASLLHGLRALMGDEAFFAHLQNYAEQNSYEIATGEDFFLPVLDLITQEELDQLIISNSDLPGGSVGGQTTSPTLTPMITLIPMIVSTPLPTP